MDARREELTRLLQDYAAEAGRLTQVFAERQAMHTTDLYALLAVLRADTDGEPLTPGRLGDHLGLSSGATTALVDRLERAGHVRRSRDDRDRRRVTLHDGEAARPVAGAFFGPLDGRMEQVLSGYSEDELAAARRFLADMTAMIRAYREEVGGA